MKNIISRDNPTYKQLKKLTESARERRKAGRTLLDGVHLIEAYVAAGGKPELLVVSESGVAHEECSRLLESIIAPQTIMLSDALFAEVSPVETPVGILALVETPHSRLPETQDFCVLLEDIQDPGNIGSILRSAAAAGAQMAWLTPGCADAWSPKVLRAGMGAHFAMAVEERVDPAEKLAAFGGISIATSLDADQSLYALDLTGPVLFLVGNEGAGLSPALQRMASVRVTIPMSGSVESLNAAAASAICFFERVRQLSH
ncbi:RNA methyltransferase [Methylobacillus sp. MM3]|uniref:TrmH family RNA methyltransferase n=1 Tax=Methylobacillus sp. MM3 TaxID=1848039 RepID=UPI0009EDB91A|nr:RNA methyltransferase [Methylobacillus sp. MM3]